VNKILEKISELGIVPVVKIENAEDALPLGRALLVKLPSELLRQKSQLKF